MKITDEAVEAAWDKLHEDPIRPVSIDYAELTAALEAAAPHMLAEAVEEMADAILTNDPLDFWAMHLPEGLGFQEAMSRWLKAHACAKMSQSPDDFAPRTYMGPCECTHFGEHDTNPPCAKVRWESAQ